MSTKRKASGPAGAPSRKHRRLSDDESDSASSSSSRSSLGSRKNAAKIRQDEDFEDSDDEISVPIAFEPLPERIRMPSKNSAPIVRSKEQPPTQATIPDFEDLGISPSLIRSLKTMSIRKPTPVQAACIPPLLAGELACASCDLGNADE